MRLNYDVLAIILSFAGRQDVERAMRTCKALYQAGIRYLLQGNIKIRSLRQLTSLGHFVLRDPEHRACHIRSLTLSSEAGFKDAPHTGALLTGLFWYACNLETLMVAQTDLLTLDNDRTLVALRRNRSLRNLVIHDEDKDARPIIESVKAPLKRVDYLLPSLRETVLEDPARLFAQFSDSLEVMLVTRVLFGPGPGPQYSHLNTLHIDDSPPILTKDLFRFFPNVRHLSIRIQRDNDLYQHEVEHLRIENMQTQPSTVNRRWNSLQMLQGGILTLYTLALQCKVDFLDLQLCPLETKHGGMLCDILANQRPSTLRLRLYLPHFNSPELGPILANAVDSLQTLSLVILASAARLDDIFSAVGTMLSTLLMFKIRLLHIRVEGAEGNIIRLHGGDELGTSSFISRLAVRFMPSLEHLVLESRTRHHVWKVLTVNGRPQSGRTQRVISKLAHDEEKRIVRESTLYQDRGIWDLGLGCT